MFFGKFESSRGTNNKGKKTVKLTDLDKTLDNILNCFKSHSDEETSKNFEESFNKEDGINNLICQLKEKISRYMMSKIRLYLVNQTLLIK